MTVVRRDLDLGELTAIVARARLSAAEREKLQGALDTLAFLTDEIGSKGASILRLRRMLFGARTEKTATVCPDPPRDDQAAAGSAAADGGAATDPARRRRPGHGRNGAESFTGAVKVCVVHGTLHHGDRCPECVKGKLYTQPQPAVLVRIRGMAPLSAVRYELERLRCNLCGEVFTAAAPAGVGEQKSAEQRLAFHQQHSGPPMRGLLWWLHEQFALRKVEPNSTLGGAVTYMIKHWQKLTRFLEQAGAPLDNNICERALKKAILHRKNSLFYKTETGAAVGDLYMSLTYTAELNGADPFDYLVQLQRHADALKANPAAWLPWNYRDTLAACASGADPPA